MRCRARSPRAILRSSPWAAARRATRSTSPTCSSAFPGGCRLHDGYSDELAHWIEAASDLFLMPSLYEPCGLNQMYSLRYGTVPLVRRTGGLADTVRAVRAARRGQGTGVVFDAFSAAALSRARSMRRSTCTRSPSTGRQLVANGMRQDFSWSRQGAALRRALRAALPRGYCSLNVPCCSNGIVRTKPDRERDLADDPVVDGRACGIVAAAEDAQERAGRIGGHVGCKFGLAVAPAPGSSRWRRRARAPGLRLRSCR